MFDDWNRTEKIGLASLVVGAVACVAALAVVPQVQLWLSQRMPSRPAKVSLSTGESVVALAGVLPSFPAQHTTINAGVLQSLSRTQLSADDLQNLSPFQLRVLRNAIYAFHGRQFVVADLRQIFGSQSWYQPDPTYSDRRLSEIEDQNIALIAREEQRHGYHE